MVCDREEEGTALVGAEFVLTEMRKEERLQ